MPRGALKRPPKRGDRVSDVPPSFHSDESNDEKKEFEPASPSSRSKPVELEDKYEEKDLGDDGFAGHGFKPMLLKPASIAMEPAEARRKATIAPAPGLNEVYEKQLRSAVIDKRGGVFSSTGALLGMVSAEGVVMTPDGVALGAISEMSKGKLLEEKKDSWLYSPSRSVSDAEAVSHYLTIPSEVDDLGAGEDAGGFSFERYISAKKHEKEQSAEQAKVLLDGLPAIREPESGFYPLGFDEREFQIERDSYEWLEFTPTIFSRRAILPPDQLPPKEVLTDRNVFFQICNREIDGSSVTFLWLDDLRKFLAKSIRQQLGKYLRLLPNLEILGLPGAGIARMDHMKLPRLLLLNVADNDIRDVTALSLMTQHSRKLRDLNVSGNPVCRGRGWKDNFPTLSNEIWSVVLSLSHLEVLNGKVIPNIDRSKALDKYGTKAHLARVPMALFNIAVGNMLLENGMKVWNPSIIKRLDLSGQGLREFHVGMLKNLEILDLSDNLIRKISGTGMEQCDHLMVLDLRNNLISSKEEPNPLKPLRYLPKLRSLFLSGNAKLENYRGAVIYLTQHLKGTNRVPGLQELDGVQITIEERVHAFQKFSKKSGKEIHMYRWKLNLINVFGHLQLRLHRDLSEKLKVLRLSDRKLREVYLADYKSLEVLDLSKNLLTSVVGLENLSKLRILDLSENPSLEIRTVYRQIRTGSLSALESVKFAPDLQKFEKKIFLTTLQELGLENRRLEFIDGHLIELDDRVEMFSKTIRRFDRQKYRFHLALLSSAVAKISSYHPDDVVEGVQYKPEEVTELLYLEKLELRDTDVDFSKFINLEKLNLADNQITDLGRIGIEKCKKLRWLDIRNNQIVNSPSQIGKIIDRLENLEVLALRGNPCLRTHKHRIQILKSISRVRDLKTNLRVLDTSITVAERVQAWAEVGDKKEDVEVLQFKAALRLRCPSNLDPAHVLALDLSRIELKFVELHEFTSLKKLKLSDNLLTKLDKTGIDSMRDLTVLDVRNNQLADINELIALVERLRCLEYLGVSGNKYHHTMKEQLLSKVSHFRQIENSLMYMDDGAIPIEDILHAIKDEFGDRQQVSRFKWDLALRRRVASEDIETPDNVKVLNVSHMGLSYNLVSWFPSLLKLDLSHNRITLDHLKKSGLEKLSELQTLNLSFNDLDDGPEVALIVCKLPRIESFDLIGNKCFPDNSRRLRVHFLKNWEGIAGQAFPLRLLNNLEISVEERMEAISGVVNESDAHRLRFEVLLSEMRVKPDSDTLDLSKHALVLVDGVRRFPALHTLNLSKNKITSLSEQCLYFLPNLKNLDLRENLIESMNDLLEGLSKCHKLENVWLQNSTADGETRIVSKYLKYVGSHLRGVLRIDDKSNPSVLSGIQRDAQEWLQEACFVGPNGVVHADFSGKELETDIFFLALAALREIGSTITLKANGNLWNKGKDRLRAYRQYCIFALGQQLKSLDGEEVLDAERLNAIDFVEDEEKQGISLIYKGGWIEARDDAQDVMEKIRKERELKKKAANGDFVDAGQMGAREMAGGDAAKKNQADFVAMRMQADKLLATQQVKILTGTFLNKLEIVINFLQVYALTFVLDINVPWPKIYLDWAKYITIFSFDIDFIFDIRLPYQQELKFIVLISLPALFLMLYMYSTTVNLQKYKDAFGEKWKKTKQNAFLYYLISLVASVLIGYWSDSESLNKISSPTNQTLSIIFVLILMSTLWSISWYWFARSFRKHYVGVDEQKFDKWWFKRLYKLRRFCLFMVTILFMPVSRLIVLQFQCVTLANGERRLDVYNERLCPDQKLYANQYVAVVFGVLYMIGLPLFFKRLIATAVKMVDAHGYKDEESIYKSALDKEKTNVLSAKEKKKLKKLKKETEDHLRKFYANEVKNNPMPQTYLYGAYERRFRYYKLFQMFQKFFVVLVTTFIPTAAWYALKLVIGNGLIGAFALTALAFRPFNDGLEDVMDIISHCTNFLNVGVALLLRTGIVDNTVSAMILLLANGTVILLFILLLIAAPIRACLVNKRFKKDKYEALESPASVEMQEKKEVEE